MLSKRDRFILIVTLVIVVISSLVGYVGYRIFDRMAPPLTTYGNEVGGSFRLVNGADGSVLDSDFRGRWMLVYFGSTHCPDTLCGATMESMAKAMDILGRAKARYVAPIFISVDPMRDTSDVLRTYTLRFGPRLFSMTGSPKMVEAVAHEYHAPYVRKPLENGDYMMEPASQIVIMSPTERYVGTIPASASAQEIADRIEQLMAEQK
ncbi:MULTISPECIES: SCO family protein [Novacetimonas]|uniref:Electron transporter SenC n=2 Tax=Novacetimonas TaxID=2919364 RepID=A0A318QQJ1_9PROT|nr:MULTISPECIES: SCO family protein [Novacetimonas]MBV1835109.1 SCO family protein [Novacetimonas pomaceti]PYD49295.1 SCO family protein [Novacetimonas pomaceti]PYD75003.1 electron transporter SenC [Novacetimonas pomaceti]RBM05345.1 SCO family protein [Novacetimonas cocois]